MILKSLELSGFKSFVDLTNVDFTHGFTVVVGPNGCGKSNISDAIRWVIGEQSSKSLRGARTTDLLFNGSEGRKPVNRTEVTLTLADVPANLRVAGVPNPGEEIKVTRCYHRSGESEFYINQVPCRLKDITDLFLDLGISPKVLSVIEQTHINHLITAKPEDRRIFIEEAAGILKFKHRRAEALRKLESSGQNLLRINDIVQELARQVESLKRQAAKAERYKRYRGEIKDLALGLSAKKLRRFQEELNRAEAEFLKLSQEKDERSAQASTVENTIARLKIEIDELSSALFAKREAVHELAGRIAKSEHAIELKRHQIGQAEADSAAADTEVAQMKEEVSALTSEAGGQRKELGDVSNEINAQETICEEKGRALEAYQEQLRYQEEQVRLGEKQVMALYQKMAQKRNDLTALETRVGYLHSRNEKLSAELAETDALLVQSRQAFARAEDSLRAHGEAFTSGKTRREEIRVGAEDCRKRLAAQSALAGTAKETFIHHQSLLQSLRELRRKFEGFDEGVRSLMSGNANGGRPAGLHEVLVDILQTPAEYEAAIGAVLGEKLQSVIVDSHTAAGQAIEYLRSHRSGRGSFIAMKPKQTPRLQLHLNGNQGILGKALNFVQCREEYRPVVDHLLADVVVVENLEVAFHLYEREDFCGTVVTRGGEVIDSLGMVSGGDKDEKDAGLLRQNREMDELTAKVETLQQEMRTAQQLADALTAEAERFAGDLREADARVHRAEMTLAETRKDLEQSQKELGRLEQKRSTVENERYAGATETQQLAVEKEDLLRAVAEAEAEKAREEETLAGLRTALDDARQGQQRRAEEIGAVRILIASLKGKRENIFSEIRRIDEAQEGLRRRIDRRETDKRGNAQKIGEYRGAIEEVERQILEQAREKDRLSEEAVLEEETLRGREETLAEREKQAKSLAQQVQETSDALARCELRRSEIKIHSAKLQEDAYEDYAVGLDELLQQYTAEVDETETEERLRELKEKTATMGEVNLAALSDFEQTNLRYTFLKKQDDDLRISIQALHEAINKIDSTTRQRFEDTFLQVNENFKACFARLFQGGQAELILLDPANPLESGVDIMAQPRGKKNQSVTLLSQGEKAMTAVALMFSIFKVRPSPFCLLDEVDAPLDEANIIRFHDLLREMSAETQFIVITHNQKTMSFADILYGVTMEERGVSKVVSVHLNN
jgi:chromosome segregation protein